MARFASGGQGVGFATLGRLTLRQRIVPDTANSFYVVAKTDRGTAFAHHFTRNSGGADTGDTGAPWANWRYVGTAELPRFEAAPTDPARFVYSDDTGAQDYAFQSSASGKFVGSYHGGAALVSEAVRIDGLPVDPTQPASGMRVTIEHEVLLTSGAATMTLAFAMSVSPTDGSLSLSIPSTSSSASFLPAYWGMGIASGTNYDQCDITLQGGSAEFSLPIGIGTTYLGAARAIRVRDGATGRAVRIETNAPGQANFRRSSLIRTAARTKWYLEGASGANASKANIVWRVSFEIGRSAVSTPGATLLPNGGFDGDLAGWSTVMTGGSVGWVAGKLRATRGASTDNRVSQAVTLSLGGVYLLSGEQIASAGNAGQIGLVNNALSYLSPTPAYPPMSNGADGYCGHVVIPTATASWVMLIQGPGTAGQTIDFDNLRLIKLADAI